MDYYQTITHSPDLQIILAAIAAFQAIVLAVIGYWNNRENKRRDALQEKRDEEAREYRRRRDELEAEELRRLAERAEVRRQESMLSINLSLATLSLCAALAAAEEQNGGSPLISVALAEAKRAEEAYNEFLVELAARELSLH